METPDEQAWLKTQFEDAIAKKKPCTIEVHSGTVYTLMFRAGKISVTKSVAGAISTATTTQAPPPPL